MSACVEGHCPACGRDTLFLGEEVGEVAKAFNETRAHPDNHSGDLLAQDLRGELIQVAAMAVAWADAL